MKLLRTKLSALLLALSLVAACGGGGGGGGLPPSGAGSDWMTVNVVSASTVTTAHKYTGSLTTDPMLIGIVSETSPTQSIVELSGSSLQVSVCAKSTSPGTFAVDSGLMCNGLQYILDSNPTSTNTYGAISGTITLTSVGKRHEPVIGSYDTIVTNLTDTKRVWGAFSIKRM